MGGVPQKMSSEPMKARKQTREFQTPRKQETLPVQFPGLEGLARPLTLVGK
jgi:hypothetical protein